MSNLRFGTVEITSGIHKGKIGYLDDEYDSENGVVYFGRPLLEESEIIPFKNMRNTEVKNLIFEKFKKQHPDLVKEAGIK